MSRFFYGWRIVAAACSLQLMLGGLLIQSFGAYVAVLAEEKGWSKTALAGAAAINSLESAIIGPVLGWVTDRFGARGVIRTGVVVFAVGLALLSQADSLVGFYVASAVMAIGSSLAGFFPLTVVVVQWFEKRRARALSTMGLGTALGGFTVPAVAWSFQAFGWRATALGSAAVAILVGLPLALAIRNRPEDMGLTVDGREPVGTRAQATAGEPAPPSQAEFTVREALRTSAFWLISFGHGVALLVVGAVNVHAINHMRIGLGYSVEQASLVMTLMTAANVGGVLTGAAIGDRHDKRRVAAVCMIAHALGLLALAWASGWPMLIAFAVLHGAAWGLRGPFMQAIRADYFGRNAIGMILGISTAIIAIGQVGGPMIAGALADLTGNYRAGFTVLALAVAAGSLLFVFAKRPVR